MQKIAEQESAIMIAEQKRLLLLDKSISNIFNIVGYNKLHHWIVEQMPFFNTSFFDLYDVHNDLLYGNTQKKIEHTEYSKAVFSSSLYYDRLLYHFSIETDDLLDIIALSHNSDLPKDFLTNLKGLCKQACEVSDKMNYDHLIDTTIHFFQPNGTASNDMKTLSLLPVYCHATEFYNSNRCPNILGINMTKIQELDNVITHELGEL